MKLIINVNAVDLGIITPFLMNKDVEFKVVECTVLYKEGAPVFYVVNMMQFQLTLELNRNCAIKNLLMEFLALLEID